MNKVFHYSVSALALASESQCKHSNAPSVRISVVDEERTRPGLWIGLVLGVPCAEGMRIDGVLTVLIRRLRLRRTRRSCTQHTQAMTRAHHGSLRNTLHTMYQQRCTYTAAVLNQQSCTTHSWYCFIPQTITAQQANKHN